MAIYCLLCSYKSSWSFVVILKGGVVISPVLKRMLLPLHYFYPMHESINIYVSVFVNWLMLKKIN